MGPNKGLVCYYCGVCGHVKPECRHRKADRRRGIFQESRPGVDVGVCSQGGVSALETEKEEDGAEKQRVSSVNVVSIMQKSAVIQLSSTDVSQTVRR